MSPVPGDPSVVHTQAERMAGQAKTMGVLYHDLIRLIEGNGYESEAISTFREEASQLAAIIQGAANRYGQTAAALQEYWPVLDEVQKTVNHAIASHNATDVNGARWHLAQAEAAVHSPDMLLASDEEKARRRAALSHAQSQLDTQQANAHLADAQYHDAIARLQKAASHAASRITQAERASGLDDTWKDNLKGLIDKLEPLVELLQNVLDDVADVCGIVGAILGPIPGLDVLGAGFDAVSLAAGRESLRLSEFEVWTGHKSVAEYESEVLLYSAGAILTLATLVPFLGEGPAAGKITLAAVKEGASEGLKAAGEAGAGRADGAILDWAADEAPDDPFYGRHDISAMLETHDLNQLSMDKVNVHSIVQSDLAPIRVTSFTSTCGVGI